MQFSSLLKWGERWRWLLFFLLVFATLKIPLSDHLHRAKGQFNVVEDCKWSACFTWMKSADVYRETGIWLALIGYALIFTFMLIGLSPLLSNIFGYTIGFFLSFFMGKYVIFRSLNGKRFIELLRCFVVFAVAFLMNFLTLNLFLKLDLSLYLCQLFFGGGFSTINYLFSRIWIFRPSQT